MTNTSVCRMQNAERRNQRIQDARPDRCVRVLAGATRLFFAALLLATPSLAQDYDPIQPLRLGSDLINLPTPRTLPTGTWEVRFTHRFSEPINDGDEHSLWGLDSSADIGIGLAYAPTANLQFGVFRTDVLDNIEASFKYALVREAPSFPLSVSFRGGVDWHTEEGTDDSTGGFAQAILSRRVGPGAEVFAVPTWASDAGSFDHAFNVPVGLAWTFRPGLSLMIEVIPENRDLPDEIGSDLGWAIGLKKAVGGHYFDVVLASSRATHVDQYVGSEFLPGVGVDSGDIHLGFNIVRRFGGR